jgi:predicted DCC family thiol-disulfide oxidoreductase YuxK
MSPHPRPLPLVLYDGDCGFCTASMRRWMNAGKGRLEFSPSQSGAGTNYGFPADQPMGALHLIEEDGRIRRGAEAVFRMMMLCGSFPGSVASRMYERVTIFRIISEWGYRKVAERRASLSKIACRLADESAK